MKITLFLGDKIMEFFLPSQISGSYSFDQESSEEHKLINVEAIDEKWMLQSKEDIQIILNNETPSSTELLPNMFYTLNREGTNYLIYTTSLYEKGIKIYNYDNSINLSIGTTQPNNIIYNIPFVSGTMAIIKIENNQLTIQLDTNILAYLNNTRIVNSKISIRYGDTLNIYGLKITFLTKNIIINNPYLGVEINELSAMISKFEYTPEKYANKDIKEIDLYSKDSYFTKSPRIRRIIEEKHLKIDPPPKEDNKDEMPAILTAGPMISMGAMSGMTLLNTTMQISSGVTTFAKSWSTIVSGCLMLTTSVLWPFLTKAFNKHLARDKRLKTIAIYNNYLLMKEEDLKKELINQKNIWEENLIKPMDCLKIINTRSNNFWCKRIEQNDFLSARVGIGKVPLSVEVEWPEEGFSIEQDDLRQLAENMINQYKYIDNCPLEYSFYENYLTAIMGVEKKCYGFVNNILIQLMTFYCYDELKIVVFTSEKNSKRWDYLKYSNYCFDSDKNFRYFATNIEEARTLSSFLIQELNYRVQISSSDSGTINPKPYYLIICDNYSNYKKVDFFKTLLELDKNIGYSTIIIENKLDKLPSKCTNFINLNEGSSGILKNSYEKAEITDFHDEIEYGINMMEIVKILSNIPVEIETEGGKLPEAIEFLEMERVGKVEQLNILNRWKTNDSTKTLKAEVGVDEEGNNMYLDLHEKFHGPHGLVAGTTGSGKSEFIITYILSMSINYSPDDVAFILIDYKGGGLAFAFENKMTGVRLPHLAGTITNLDKSEMNRTLVSIDSEVKRRQAQFNEARDLLGESTIDIYKYQRFYHEGKLSEPIPHLFIISDEFAELKSQQPEFMDNLISVARIGRSLGVHLILATQKPSGVVNDQIWSNTKFRVCLKVADASDSNEMLKKPDAALLKQSGRFYLQVGMDELYALGQSGWAGAKYYPSDTVEKVVDKSINFIDNNGQVIKTIQESVNSARKESQGEQLAAIMGEIIKVANQVDKHARKLWLDNIPPIILHDEIEKKYDIKHVPYNIIATLGEYDAPELQQQGPLIYNLLNDENLLICGTDGGEREKMLTAMIYSICKNHTTEEVNIYTIDYGSESLRMFANLPHIGGMVFSGEQEKYTNLTKMINEETSKRKKLFIDYGGDYVNYIKNSGKTIPLKIIIMNNYDTIKEDIQTSYDEVPELLRDSARYGIIYIITANSPTTTSTRINQNLKTTYALRLKDYYEYSDALGGKTKQVPQDTEGRGMINNDGIHEFQTVSLVNDISELSKFIIDFTTTIKNSNQPQAKKIPTLPENVRLEDVEESITGIESVPIGIQKNSLEVETINLKENIGSLVLSNKLSNIQKYTRSFIALLKSKKVSTILIDGTEDLKEEKTNVANYFNTSFDEVINKVKEYVETSDKTENTTNNVVIYIYGIDKIISKISDIKILEELLKAIKKNDNIPIIIAEDVNKMKQFMFDNWYKEVFSNPVGVWIGSGASDQTILKISGYNKEHSVDYPNNMGFYIADGSAKLCKFIDFITEDGDSNE